MSDQVSGPAGQTDAAPAGYRKAIALLHACSTEQGFVASPTQSGNYRRIWGRDGAIIALAALMTGDDNLRDGARRTFETLARYQGPHGEIPSNVEPVSERISYGGTTGRVDANLWFVIGCGEYWRATGDDAFLEQLVPVIERVRFLLGAWEFNNRGLLYIPLTGDWADEYLHNGYVLYDQLLYLQAQRTLASIHSALHGSMDHALTERISRLRHLIRANALPMDDEPWGFAEYIHGKDLTPRGTRCQGWSAAGAIMAHRAIEGRMPFRIQDSL